MKRPTQIMKRISAVFCVWLIWSSVLAHGTEVVAVDDNLPPLTLMSSDSPKVRAYLGLDNASAFSLSQIEAKIVIIELFSLYCTICQRQAPIANRIYKSIQGGC